MLLAITHCALGFSATVFAISNVDSQHLKHMSSSLKNMSSALPGFSHERCNIPAEYGISCIRDTDSQVL